MEITHGKLDSMVNNRNLIGVMSKSLPAATSMQLAKIIRRCNDELVEYTVAKQAIIQEYSMKDNIGNPVVTPGNTIEIDPDRSIEAAQKIKEIAEIPVSTTFNLPKFGFDADAFPNITPQEALALLPFTKDVFIKEP